jgi:rare lipoprotein A
LVTDLDNDKTVVVRINDRGPHTRGRLIDLSRKAAAQLGMLHSGVTRVRVQTLSD